MIDQFDRWLVAETATALVIREHLIPAEGKDGVLFPPTFAAGDGFPGGYNIDVFPDGSNVCLIDSVGSQANRIEPLFATGDYVGLVPQIVVRAGKKKVKLLEAGHRAGDAIVRCSALQKELRDAFQAALEGNAEPLAKIAPTSLIFGVWDSRDTQAKFPRLIASTVRAFNVRKLTRSAVFIPAVDYVGEGLLEEPADKKSKDTYAERGFVHVPASNTHGGVIADGGIRRDAILHLSALRLLRAVEASRTLLLRRYVLGLALTSFTYPAAGYLRQGCNLVLDPEKDRQFEIVMTDGTRGACTLDHSTALEFARMAAREFGIDPDRKITPGAPPDREVEFDKDLAKKDLSEAGSESRKGARKSTGKTA